MDRKSDYNYVVTLHALSPPPPGVPVVCMLRFNIIIAYTRASQIEEKDKSSTNSSPPLKAANTQQPKAANNIPESTCPSHLSTPAPETSRKVSTVEADCPTPPPFQPPSLLSLF